MKRTSQPDKLIIPGRSGRRLEIEDFSELIPAKAFGKIERILGTASPLHGFRESLTRFLWYFYVNSLPEAEIKVSRAVLEQTLRRAAERAEELAHLTEQLLASENVIVFRELGEFARVRLDSQSSQPLHRSGVGFVGVLDEFALKTLWLAQALPPDHGGPREATPFDRLVKGLGDWYRQLAGEEPFVSTQKRFFPFIAAVVDVLRAMEEKLPAPRFNLPPNDNALRTRLKRLAQPVCT